MLSQNYHTCIRGNSNSAIFLIDLLELKEYIIAPKDGGWVPSIMKKTFREVSKKFYNPFTTILYARMSQTLFYSSAFFFLLLLSVFLFFRFRFRFGVSFSFYLLFFFLRISSKKSSVSVGYSGAIPNDNSSYLVFRWF